MPLFKSMKTPFHQPLIPVVLCALVERHPAFGKVGCKNPPTGEQSELLDRRFISMHHQGKASNVHYDIEVTVGG